MFFLKLKGKHMGLALHNISCKNIKEVLMVVQNDTKVKKYLKTLSKEKLITLLMEYSTDNFKKEILLRDAPDDVINISLNKIISSVNRNLDDEELLYNPEKFQEKISLSTIETNSYGGFDFIIYGFKKLENIEDLESLWKAKNISQYYKYLEKEQRIEEMYALLSSLPENREKFLKKHKLAYKEEAIGFFNAQITENLKTTGDGYYHNIADLLWQLKALIEEEEFKSRVEALKFEYKRRRNFVGILLKRFG